MGQYYLVVNPVKRQFLHPHKFNEGLKLMEFGCSSEGTMLALALLLSDGNGRGGGDLNVEHPLIGSWAGDPVIVAGDYADPGSHVPEADLEIYNNENEDKNIKPTLYAVASKYYEDISEKVRDELIAKDGYTKFSPTDENFKDSTIWVFKQREKEKKYNYSKLTLDDLHRVLYFVCRKGEGYFKAYKRWLLKRTGKDRKNLSPEVRESLLKTKFHTGR